MNIAIIQRHQSDNQLNIYSLEFAELPLVREPEKIIQTIIWIIDAEHPNRQGTKILFGNVLALREW